MKLKKNAHIHKVVQHKQDKNKLLQKQIVKERLTIIGDRSSLCKSARKLQLIIELIIGTTDC